MTNSIPQVELYLDNFTSILNIYYDESRRRCEFDSELYIFWVQALYYVIPFIAMCTLYVGIIYEIFQGMRRRLDGSRDHVRQKIKIMVTTTLITLGFFVTWFPYFYTMTENVVFGKASKGFKGTIVMFYFNLLWDSVVYALRTPLIYKMIMACFKRRTYNGSSAPIVLSKAMRNSAYRSTEFIETVGRKSVKISKEFESVTIGISNGKESVTIGNESVIIGKESVTIGNESVTICEDVAVISTSQ